MTEQQENKWSKVLQIIGGLLTASLTILLFSIQNPQDFSSYFWANWKSITVVFFLVMWTAIALIVYPLKARFQGLWGKPWSGWFSVLIIGLVVATITVFFFYRKVNELRKERLYLNANSYQIDQIFSTVGHVAATAVNEPSSQTKPKSDTETEQNKQEQKIAFRLVLVEDFSTHQSVPNGIVDSLVIKPDPNFANKIKEIRAVDGDEQMAFDKIYALLTERYGENGIKNPAFADIVKRNIRTMTYQSYSSLKALRIENIEDAEEVLANKEKFKTYMDWEINYMGQWTPKVRLSAVLPEKYEKLVVFDVFYNVEAFELLPSTFKFQGGNEPRPYQFNLPLKKGKHKVSLHGSHMNVARPDDGFLSIDLLIKPEVNRHFHARWRGRISIETNKGEIEVGYLDMITYSDSSPFFFKRSR